MMNAERRAALNEARKMALHHAKLADRRIDGYAITQTDAQSRHIRLSVMWAHVADAMKVGDVDPDNVDGIPADTLTDTTKELTR